MSNKLTAQSKLHKTTEEKLAHAEYAPKQMPRPPEILLHELQVSRIELEMLNEQLRQARVELEKSRDRFVNFYEFAPVGYLTLTREGLIAEVNLTGSTLLGVERKKLLNCRFAGFVIPDDSDRWHSHFLNVVQSNLRQNYELVLRRGDGSHVHVRLDCLRMEADNASSVYIALTNITERRKTDRALLESEERWAFAIDGSGDGVWDWDMQTGKVVFSERYKEMLGYAGNEVWSSLDEWKSRVNGEDMHHAMQELEAYLDGKRAIYTAEYRMRCKDGSWKWMLVRGKVVSRADDGRPLRMIGTHTDITGRKQMERKLRDLTAHMQTVREEEKISIAREIHDDLGGTLTALKMETFWLTDELSVIDKAVPLLKHTELMGQLVDNATSAMRRIITGLRPAMLDDLGLLAAIEWYAVHFQKSTSIECQVECIDHGKLSSMQSTHLFRILQEALTNVAKHSHASRVTVEMQCSDEEITLSISDNGRGIPESHTVAFNSYGILGMNERVESLGGNIKCGNSLGGGFSVKVKLPLADNIFKEEKYDQHPDC